MILVRFAPREPDDPIDVASFRATVNGVDRTAQFRVTNTEAWGTLGDSVLSPGATRETRAPVGPHALAVRVCSARGACGALSAVVQVRTWDRALSPEQLLGINPLPNHTMTVSRAEAAAGSSRRVDTGV
jgi:hypothetical protein